MFKWVLPCAWLWRALPSLFYLALIETLGDQGYFHVYFIDEETEAWRRWERCLRSFSQPASEPGFWPGCLPGEVLWQGGPLSRLQRPSKTRMCDDGERKRISDRRDNSSKGEEQATLTYSKGFHCQKSVQGSTAAEFYTRSIPRIRH